MQKLIIVSEFQKYKQQAFISQQAQKNHFSVVFANLAEFVKSFPSYPVKSIIYFQIPYSTHNFLEADRYLLVNKLIDGGFRVLNSASLLNFPFENKLLQKETFRKNKIKTPKFFVYFSLNELIKAKLPYPLVIKRKIGSRGIEMRLVYNVDEILGFFSNHLLQEFYFEQAIISSYYHKIYVFNNEVYPEFNKPWPSSLNKLTKKNLPLTAPLKQKLISLAFAAAKVYQTDFCSVDIINDQQSEYVLEVNRNAPGLPETDIFFSFFFKNLSLNNKQAQKADLHKP